MRRRYSSEIRTWSLAAVLLATALSLSVERTALAAPPSADDLARLNAAIVQAHIVPAQRAFAKATDALLQAAHGFCRAPDAAALERLREAYHGGMDAWMGVQHIRFGPIELFSRAQRIQFWPDPRDVGSRHLGRTLRERRPKLLTEQTFPRMSVAVQGLPALERLLFEDALVRSLLARDAAGRYACALLEAIARNLEQIAAGMLAGWSTGEGTGESYLHWTTHPRRENPFFHTPREVTRTLLTNFAAGLEQIAERRLGSPLGESAEQARPRLAESWRSGRSLRNVARGLRALGAFAAAGGDEGLLGLLRSRGEAALADALAEGLAAAAADAERIGVTLHEAVRQPRARADVLALQARVAALRTLVAARVTVALDTPLGFNSLDGD